MKKIFYLLMIFILTSVLLIACNHEKVDSNQSDSEAENTTEQVEMDETATVYPLEIEIFDEQGEKYIQVFEQAPEKVITNNLSSTEILLQLGLEDKIVGILEPDNEVTGEFADTIARLNNLGDKMTVSKEVIVGVNPDLVVGRSLMFDDEYMGSITTLNDLNINVFTQSASIPPNNPSLTAIIDDVLTLGKIFNVNDRAEEYAAQQQARYEAIQRSVGKEKGDKELTVLAMVGLNSEDGTFFSFDITNGLQRDVLTTLHLKPAIEGRADNSNYESLISVNPDIILYIKADRNADLDAIAIETLYSEPLIKDVAAIKEERVITTTYDDFMDYGVRIFDTLELLNEEIYGE